MNEYIHCLKFMIPFKWCNKENFQNNCHLKSYCVSSVANGINLKRLSPSFPKSGA